MKENEIMKMLFDVTHPGKGDKNIVELGLVDKVEIDGDKVTLTLAFPKHRDPLTEYLVGSAKAAIYRHAPEVKDVEVKTVVREESAPKKQTGLNLTLDEVNNVRHIIGVASGKGGVGKSTVAVNLAVALARLGYKVGLADADVYGPSVPKMTATEGALPEAIKEGEGEVIMPIEKYGVKWMSIGYFSEPGQALIWRGPMACNALKQMILQVRWGVLDFLLIDMPPGTGRHPYLSGPGYSDGGCRDSDNASGCRIGRCGEGCGHVPQQEYQPEDFRYRGEYVMVYSGGTA